MPERYYGLWAEDPLAAMAWLRALPVDAKGHRLKVVLPCCPSVTYFIDDAARLPHDNLPCPHGNYYVAYR